MRVHREAQQEIDMNLWIEWAVSTFCGLLMQQKYCPVWNAKLNQLLEKYGDSAALSVHTVLLGDCEVWVGNRFYSYGHFWGVKGSLKSIDWHRPSVATMVRLAALHDRLARDVADRKREEYLAAIRSIE
jgi:hypothetical protein